MKKINSEKASAIFGGTEYFHSQKWNANGECSVYNYKVVRGPTDKHGNGSVNMISTSDKFTRTSKAACPTKEWTTFS